MSSRRLSSFSGVESRSSHRSSSSSKNCRIASRFPYVTPRYSRYIPNDQGYDADVEDSVECPQCRRQNASPQRSNHDQEESSRFCPQYLYGQQHRYNRAPSQHVDSSGPWSDRYQLVFNFNAPLIQIHLDSSTTKAYAHQKAEEAVHDNNADSTKKVPCPVKEIDERVEMVSEEITEAVDSMDSDDVNGCHSDCADTMESNHVVPTCVNESPSSSLNTSCSCCSDTDEHEDDEESCHSVYADTIESDDSHSLNTSCSCCNDTDEPESESSSDDSSVIDVDNHPDVRLLSNDNEHVQPMVNLSGATIVQIHLDSSTVVSIPGANVKNTSKTSNTNLMKCRNVNRSRFSANNYANKNMCSKSNCTNKQIRHH